MSSKKGLSTRASGLPAEEGEDGHLHPSFEDGLRQRMESSPQGEAKAAATRPPTKAKKPASKGSSSSGGSVVVIAVAVGVLAVAAAAWMFLSQRPSEPTAFSHETLFPFEKYLPKAQASLATCEPNHKAVSKSIATLISSKFAGLLPEFTQRALVVGFVGAKASTASCVDPVLAALPAEAILDIDGSSLDGMGQHKAEASLRHRIGPHLQRHPGGAVVLRNMHKHTAELRAFHHCWNEGSEQSIDFDSGSATCRHATFFVTFDVSGSPLAQTANKELETNCLRPLGGVGCMTSAKEALLQPLLHNMDSEFHSLKRRFVAVLPTSA